MGFIEDKVDLINKYKKNLTNSYEKDGVILIKDVLLDSIIEDVRNEYDKLDRTLTNQEILFDEPLIVFWKHVAGEQKRIASFKDFPALWVLINEHIIPVILNAIPKTKRLQLLETIIFNKPAKISNVLNWHQDVSYFPLKPNNQIAVWIPFEMVTAERGAMNYAIGTHKKGAMGSINLHTREKFENEDRELIPEDPAAEGYEVRCMEMSPNDVLIHDGYIWHYSCANTVEGYTRKGLSVRFITDEAAFDPRPGQGAAFTKQIKIEPGEVVKGAPFPTLYG